MEFNPICGSVNTKQKLSLGMPLRCWIRKTMKNISVTISLIRGFCWKLKSVQANSAKRQASTAFGKNLLSKVFCVRPISPVNPRSSSAICLNYWLKSGILPVQWLAVYLPKKEVSDHVETIGGKKTLTHTLLLKAPFRTSHRKCKEILHRCPPNFLHTLSKIIVTMAQKMFLTSPVSPAELQQHHYQSEPSMRRTAEIQWEITLSTQTRWKEGPNISPRKRHIVGGHDLETVQDVLPGPETEGGS